MGQVLLHAARNHSSHHLLVLHVLPDAVWCYYYHLVCSLYCVLQQLGLGICSCFYTCLVTKWTGHGKAGHHDVFHPDSSWAQFFPYLVGLGEDPASTFKNSLLLVRSLRFLIIRKRINNPLEQFMRLLVGKLGKFLDIFLLFTKISLDLLQQNSPRISNIKAIYFFLIDKNGNKSGSCQFGVDLTIKKLLIGGLQGNIDDLNKFLTIWTIMIFLQRTVKVFSLYPQIYLSDWFLWMRLQDGHWVRGHRRHSKV